MEFSTRNATSIRVRHARPVHAGPEPVWNAEYSEDGETTGGFCSTDVSAGIIGALFSINLDGSEFQPCKNDVGSTN